MKSIKDRVQQSIRDYVESDGSVAQNKSSVKRTDRSGAGSSARNGSSDRRSMPSATSMDLPLYYENAFNTDSRTVDVHADSAADGLMLSLANLGCVDIEYISAITGMEHRDIISALKGSIYQNPEKWGGCFYMGWETADEYLSGNLKDKFAIARRANLTYPGWFDDNVRAIKAFLPEPVTCEDIFVTIGSPWVPAEIYDEFIIHMLGESGYFMSDPSLCVKHDVLTGTWEVPFKDRYYRNARSYSTYGTHRMEALHILERTLNMKSVAVYDEVACNTTKSGKRRVLNKPDTAAAMEKQARMIEEFRSWIWQETHRKNKVLAAFDAKFGSYRNRSYNGAYLTFPGMNENYTLYSYQKDAVARILFSPNTLLAHDVGAGKTYIMIAAGMEARRIGLSKKHLYAVPNNIVGQWENIFRELYPQAKIFVVQPKSFTPDKRDAVLARIRDEDFDAIIMAHSTLDMIPLSRAYYDKKLRERKKLLDELSRNKAKCTDGVRRECKKTEKLLNELYANFKATTCSICFDELGIDKLFVDEAHCYKNVPIETQLDNVLGVNADGSKKCQDMLDRVRTVQKQNGSVIMATGTPITNSVADVFVFQQYLQSGALALLDLSNFDAWVGMFAERTTEFEIDVDTNNFRMATRLAKFHNLTELTSLLSSIADFHHVENERGLPVFNGYTDRVVTRTPAFAAYLKKISERADAVRHGKIARSEDNMLKITGDGRRAALDLRIVDPDQPFTVQSKVMCCAEEVFRIYRMTDNDRCTQLVFCDSSTPKDGFNMYDELTRLLIYLGIPASEIAFVHDATTEKKRTALFNSVQSSKIRVLIGSTPKLGIGVNVQNRLVAVHHLDVPWRPADMVQREGRIIRPGNENERIFIYRYITEGSFDAYSWQLLETKQKFISALLGGTCKENSGEDIDNVALSYAEVKALAIGNPLIKQRVEYCNEFTRLVTLQNKLIENRERLQRQKLSIPNEITALEKQADDIDEDLKYVEEYGEDKLSAAERKELRERIFDELSHHVLMPNERTVALYRGFAVVLPRNMSKLKLSLFIVRKHRYFVDVGDSSTGLLIRIDNVIKGLSERKSKAVSEIRYLCEQHIRIQEELDKDENYADRIEEVRLKIAEIDEKLKVKK